MNCYLNILSLFIYLIEAESVNPSVLPKSHIQKIILIAILLRFSFPCAVASSTAPTPLPTTLNPSLIPTTIEPTVSVSPTTVPTFRPTFIPSLTQTPTVSVAPSTAIPSFLPSQSMKPTTNSPIIGLNPSYKPSLTARPSSTQGFVSWSQSTYTTTSLTYLCMSTNGSRVIAATAVVNNLVCSVNYGLDYTRAVIDDDTSQIYGCMSCSATAQFAATMISSGAGGKFTSDYGKTWTQMNFGSVTKDLASSACACD